MPGKSNIYIIVDAVDKGTATIRKFDKNTEQTFSKMRQNADRATKGMGGSLQSLKKHWVAYSAAAVAAVLAVRRAITGIISTISDWVEASKKQEDAEIALQAALETTGRDVNALLPSLKAYASYLQSVTKYGDEAVIQSMGLIAQLTNLNEQGLKRATEGAIGLATVYKQDLQAATTLVGKALAGNYGALSRYGIVVEETMSDEEKRAEILRQLTVMYDRAKKETLSFSGTQEQLKNLYGDIKEKLGGLITKNEVVLEAMQELKDWLVKVNEEFAIWIEKNKELIEQKTREAIEKLVTALRDLYNIFSDIYDVAKKIYDIWGKMPDVVKAGIVSAIAPGVGFLKILREIRKESEEIKNKVTLPIPKQEPTVEEEVPTETWIKPIPPASEMLPSVTGPAEYGIAEDISARVEMVRKMHEDIAAITEEANWERLGMLEAAMNAETEWIKRGLDEQTRAYRQANLEKMMIAQNWVSFSKVLSETMFALSDRESKVLFYISRAAAVAEATVNAYVAYSKMLALFPLNPGIAHSVLALGLANAGAIAAMSIKGGMPSGGGAGVGTATPTYPVSPYTGIPETKAEEKGPDVHVHIYGDVTGEATLEWLFDRMNDYVENKGGRIVASEVTRE